MLLIILNSLLLIGSCINDEDLLCFVFLYNVLTAIYQTNANEYNQLLETLVFLYNVQTAIYIKRMQMNTINCWKHKKTTYVHTLIPTVLRLLSTSRHWSTSSWTFCLSKRSLTRE